MAKTKSTRPESKTAQLARAIEATRLVPKSLEYYLADQQDRARELQDILRLLKDDPESSSDNGAIVAAWRMARDLNNALDAASVTRVVSAPTEVRS